MNVKIVIKSATQSVEDFSIDCDLTWTIGYLKEKLEELYPNKPKKESQKLIYGGKLLPDHLSLKSVLNPVSVEISQDKHTIHLVCPSPTKVDTSSKDCDKKDSTSQPFTPTNPAFAPLNQPILNPPTISGMPGISIPPVNPTDAFQQYLVMQQMYAQLMTQYLSQYNSGVPPVIPYAPGMNVPPVQSPQVPAPQQNVTPQQPRRPAEEEERDYLDYLHIISRAVLLFALLYYYSSLTRILIVVSMYLFISVYVKLNRQNQEQELLRQRNERQSNEPRATQEAPADIQTTGEETVSSVPAEITTNDATLTRENEGRNFVSAVSTTVSLISAFFSSLIPSEPLPVNVN